MFGKALEAAAREECVRQKDYGEKHSSWKVHHKEQGANPQTCTWLSTDWGIAD